MSGLGFDLIATDGAARRGRLTTPHGVVETPCFMPVGTAGTVKGLYPAQLRAIGAEIVLSNTYHLMLRPGPETVASLGGLHEFMGWDGPILTDSGGFQVMSLAKLRKIDRDGVTFRSHLDGSEHRLTPERAVEIQSLLGADIAMQLDECIRLPAPTGEIARAMELSLDWAARSKAAFGTPEGRALFGIVQGGDDRALRSRSAAELVRLGFDGYAIGGLAVGEPRETMVDIVTHLAAELPESRPRYLMGVGKPEDLIAAVAAGVDMFDCVHPTRAGRHGHAFTSRGVLNLDNARHRDDPRPLDETATSENARTWSRAYLHHLVRAGEILGAIILSEVNLAYYLNLMAAMRLAIEAGTLEDCAASVRAGWARGDLDPIG